MAKASGGHPAALTQLLRQVAPGDETIAGFWGLTGWSLNWWIAASQVFGILLVLPFMFGLRSLYNTTVPVCGCGVALLSASWWTRTALVIVITKQRQVLCCRIARPFQRKTISQAPIETVRLAYLHRGWLYGQVRYCGPGTNGKTVRLNLPAGCRPAVQHAITAVPELAAG